MPMQPSKSSEEADGFRWLAQPADMASFVALREFVMDAAKAAGLNKEQLWKLELVFEEVVVNVIRYAYPAGTPDTVSVGYAVHENHFAVQVRDSGKPFDPIAGADPDLTLGIAERRIGGLGRFLTRQLASHAEYARQDGHNVLTFGI
jgi:anti-sigma regulatory factor (Ser/Thr protein kinase)